MPDNRYFHISPRGKLTSLETLDQALEMSKSEGFIWLDYSQPTKEMLSMLSEPLGLHPLAIEDCVDDNQIPKIEDYPKHTFILFNSYEYHNGDFEIQEVDLFIGSNFLISVSKQGLDRRPFFEDMEHFVRLDIKASQQGPAFLAHVLLDHIVDHKFQAIETLEDDLNLAEETILGNLDEFDPSLLLELRHKLLALRKSLFHEREILMRISRKDCRFIPEKALIYYRDIYDHLAKFFELTETYRDLVTSLMEMYLSMINNQMAKISNDTNTTVRRLTLITTIFMPLTLLAGIGGMSEWSMMTGPENWRIAYPIFLLLMAVLGIANYFFLKWLDKKRD